MDQGSKSREMGMAEERNPKKEDSKDKLADLDSRRGWGMVEKLDWDEEVDKEQSQDQRSLAHQNESLRDSQGTPGTALAGEHILPFPAEEDTFENSIMTEDDKEYLSAHETPEDGPSTQTSSSRRHGGQHSINYAHHMEVTSVGDGETNQSLQPREAFELPPGVISYLEHRFGPKLNYEGRCPCHERLVDDREERRRAERRYYARYGTGLLTQGCTLRVYPQDDIPGTEEVDKPMITVTTPDEEVFWPHDDREELEGPPSGTIVEQEA